MRGRTQFLGLAFDPMGPDAAACAIAARGRKLERFVYVTTPNVDHLVRLDRRPELRPLYQDAWLNLCDSRVLEFFAELSRVAVPAAPGADIVERLFGDHIDPHDTVLIVGGSADLVRTLRARYALADIRWHEAPTGLENDAEARAQCIDFIRNNPAPFLFLAVGSPRQELIAHEVLKRGGAVGVAICCGASLDFLAGPSKRAPKWMQSSRLAWLHRLNSEPDRLWRRYLIDGPRIVGIWRRWLAEVR